MKGRFQKHQHPPLFLEDANIFQKSARVVHCRIAICGVLRETIFENVLIFEKKGGGGLLIFRRVCVAGCMGRTSHTNFKKSYGDFQNRNFEKAHSTTSPRSDMRLDL